MVVQKGEIIMRGKGSFLIFTFAVVFLFLAVAPAQGRVYMRFNLNPNIYITIPRSPAVSISVDRGEGATYYVGDPITIRYSVDRQGYVNLIDYLPNGDVNVLVRNQYFGSGRTETYRGTVSGPAGTERLVILFTPTPVSEGALQDFIQNPHQAGRIFTRYAVNRTHFNVAMRTRGTVLTLQPSTANVAPGGTISIRASLSDVSGNPLPGRNINWSTSSGSLSSYQTVTDARGVTSVTFYAPRTPQVVTISANFSGEHGLAPTSSSVEIEVVSVQATPILEIRADSLTLQPGERVKIDAYLRRPDGRPVYGRTIYWSASIGSLSTSSVITDSLGKVTVYYTAPRVYESTPFEITAEFRGAPGLNPTSATVSGMIEVFVPETPTVGMYYVDFSGRSTQHNVLDLNFSGNIASNYTLNGTQLLEMDYRDYLEFSFPIEFIPQKAKLLCWLQTDEGAKVRIYLNGNLVSSATQKGIMEPSDYKSFTLQERWFESGQNTLRIEVEAPRGSFARIQRILIIL